MLSTNRVRKPALIFGLTLLMAVCANTFAQEISEDMVGQNEQAWTVWQTASKALDRDEKDLATQSFEKVVALNLSDLRLALMADRTGSLRLDQWAEREDAPAPVKTLIEKIKNGRKQKAMAEDGWHYAAIGRFKYADASFKALDESNPDPVALLELARQNPNRHDILVKLMGNAEVGPSAKRFLAILGEGEERLRMDPYEIVANVARLGGQPRMAYNAVSRLKESGEYAVPHLIQALQDSSRTNIHPAIIQIIPQLGRSALNPLCMALGATDDVTKLILIDALAKIGYKQSAPYLAKLADSEKESAAVRSTAQRSLLSLGATDTDKPSTLFVRLAAEYYDNAESLRADARYDTANVWFLRSNELKFVQVPRAIFNDVMTMRTAEEALLSDASLAEAVALWVAADFRREAKLGLDVESDKPSPLANKDATRPEDFPRAIYFARAAGALYNHMVLARAFKDRDPGVALGAIAALRDTAGAGNLIGRENVKQALAESLAFPNRQVRIKAALALGAALPKSNFEGSQNVIPVLSEALMQAGLKTALVIDPDDDMRNKLQALMRSMGYDCALGANLYEAKQKGQEAGIASYDVIFIASNVRDPDLAAAIGDIRQNFATAATPILILTKEDDVPPASRIARNNGGVEVFLSEILEMGDPAKISEQMTSKLGRASQTLGMTALAADRSLDLALQSAAVLRLIAETNSQVFDVSRAGGALIKALQSASQTLRVSAAHSLALLADASAQAALAELALDSSRNAEERIAVFGSLAESARRNGNLLGGSELVRKLIEFTLIEKDLVLRAAGSKALGALDLPSNKASEIIRAQHNG